MPTILGIPVLLIVLMLQTAVASRLPLLHGTADIMLLTLAAWALVGRGKAVWFWTVLGGLMISLVSAVPLMIPLVGYLLMTLIANFFKRMVWQAPILAMVVVVVLGTLIQQGLTIFALQFTGVALPLDEAISQVTMPSLLLNLMLSFPVYLLFADAAAWLYPVEMDA